MKDRVGQVWHVGTNDMYQTFVVLEVGSEYSRGFNHLRLILSSNWEDWPGKVAPYPEEDTAPWERIDYFKRIT